MAASVLQREGIAGLFEEADCTGQLCVQNDDGSLQIGVRADSSAVAASTIKVLIAVEAERRFAAGTLDPFKRIKMNAEARTPGPTGFSLYADDVEASARDLVVAMLTISDNVATDALLALVGIDACNETARTLGLTGTVIVSDLRSMIDELAHAAGFASWSELAAALSRATPDELTRLQRRVYTCDALDPQRATRTTPRDMCRLLRAIWTGEAAPADGCTNLRRLMGRQLTRDRLAAGFAPPMRVSAKSGGLVGLIRNEIGVIEYPDGRWYAAAVFTQANSPASGDEAIDAVIGQAAAKAVGLLRSNG